MIEELSYPISSNSDYDLEPKKFKTQSELNFGELCPIIQSYEEFKLSSGYEGSNSSFEI